GPKRWVCAPASHGWILHRHGRGRLVTGQEVACVPSADSGHSIQDLPHFLGWRHAQNAPARRCGAGTPRWSGDGTRLVFGDVPEHFGIQMGGEVVHICGLRNRSESDLQGSEGLWSSRWSPDGRYIAALTIVGQRLKLLDLGAGVWRLMNADHID